MKGKEGLWVLQISTETKSVLEFQGQDRKCMYNLTSRRVRGFASWCVQSHYAAIITAITGKRFESNMSKLIHTHIHTHTHTPHFHLYSTNIHRAETMHQTKEC